MKKTGTAFPACSIQTNLKQWLAILNMNHELFKTKPTLHVKMAALAGCSLIERGADDMTINRN
jgi:hypothetical protein